jgi:hypothetical protein
VGAPLLFGSVLEDDPTLRLVVAWEAQAPSQDFGVGIFAKEIFTI